MWDLLQPLATPGFGGKVRSVAASVITEGSVTEVSEARAYLVRPPGGDIIALSSKCTHLGCKVPYCESSGRFECPCHGTTFNLIGEYLTGPAPRGMDTHPVEVGADGLLYIDTGTREDGPVPGVLTLDEPATGPSCDEGGHA